MLVDNFNGTDLALIESSAIEPTRTAERSLLHFKGNRYFTHPIIDEDLSAMEVLSPGFSIPRVKYNPFDIKSLMNYNTNDHNSAVKEHVNRNKREDERYRMEHRRTSEAAFERKIMAMIRDLDNNGKEGGNE